MNRGKPNTNAVSSEKERHRSRTLEGNGAWGNSRTGAGVRKPIRRRGGIADDIDEPTTDTGTLGSLREEYGDEQGTQLYLFNLFDSEF